MKAITFTIELVQPMLATGLEGDPNAGVSLPYIPGSVLRGAIIGLFLQNTAQADLAKTERKLFFSDDVCFLNAYPLVEVAKYESPKRSLPTPLSWHKEKDGTEKGGEDELDRTIYDFAKTTAKAQDAKGEKQFKGLSAKFFAFKESLGSNVIKAELKTRIAVHTRRNPTKGRATDDDGDVFRYESIEAGTKFGGVIMSDDNNLSTRIRGLIEDQEISVGGSRTGGYGRARIQTVTEEKDWQELRRWSVSDIENAEFTITLLSNALIRNENGQFQAELSAETLGLTDADIELQTDKTYKKSDLVGGFNRKWGLPLPQQVSIKAGSIFTFKANHKIHKGKVEEWLNKGIGERRLDGFGRIAVNLNSHLSLTLEVRGEHELFATGLVSPQGLKIGQTIVNRLLRHRFENRLIEYIGSKDIRYAPTNSQLSRLRLSIRQILRNMTTLDEAKRELDAFFNNLKSTAREQFEKAGIKKWATSVLEKTDLFDDEAIELGDDAHSVTSEKDALQFEFRLRLIDGVLAKTAKENRQ